MFVRSSTLVLSSLRPTCAIRGVVHSSALKPVVRLHGLRPYAVARERLMPLEPVKKRRRSEKGVIEASVYSVVSYPNLWCKSPLALLYYLHYRAVITLLLLCRHPFLFLNLCHNMIRRDQLRILQVVRSRNPCHAPTA